MCGCLSCAPYWGPGLHPGLCPDWELNWRSFGLQAGIQSTEPHQPGLPILTLSLNSASLLWPIYLCNLLFL